MGHSAYTSRPARFLLLLGVLVFALAPAATAHADSLVNSFKQRCTPAAYGSFDPIVFPGINNVGHSHEFFCNTTINPSSTGFTLQSQFADTHTTSEDRFEGAAIWAPEIDQDGVRVPPRYATVYYSRVVNLHRSDGTVITSVVPPPTDFRMIAGNKDATSPQKSSIMFYSCSNSTHQGPVPPDCSADGGLVAHVFFPSCWSGNARTGTTDDVLPYTVLNSVATCPAGHDTAITKVFANFHYPNITLPDCSLGLSPCAMYSLGGGMLSVYGYHADYMNGWGLDDLTGQFDLDGLVARCNNDPDNSPACDIQRTTPPGDAFDQNCIDTGVCPLPTPAPSPTPTPPPTTDVGPNSAATGADDASAGQIAWLNPGNVVSSNDARATSSLSASKPASHLLKATGFGFNVPTSATITGVKVEVERSQGSATDVHDSVIQLTTGGALIGSNKADAATLWPVGTAESYATYGGLTDGWGAGLTPAQVNDPSFGVAIQAALTTSTSVARVDHVRVTVRYSG